MQGVNDICMKGGEEEMLKAVKIEPCVCLRCGHKWMPRAKIEDDEVIIEKPTTCPNSNCRSAYWNKTRVRNYMNNKMSLNKK